MRQAKANGALNVVKQFGEVNTPNALRHEMLDSLEQDFWSKPRTVFEPCCGSGGFVIDCLERFLHGLQTIRERDRFRFIVEHCLFWADINPDNVRLTAHRLSTHPWAEPGAHYRFNAYCGDSLTIDLLAQPQGLAAFFPGAHHRYSMQFDAVITNPPFQTPTKGARTGGWGGKTLWDRFVVHTLDNWLRADGTFVCVHPSNWRKPMHELWPWLSKRDLRTLHIHGEADGRRIFGCGVRYDWYVLRNRAAAAHAQTVVRDEHGQWHRLQLSQWPFLPNAHFALFGQLFAVHTPLGQSNTFEVLFSRSAYGSDKKHVQKEPSATFPFPCVHSMNARGLTLLYSSTRDNGHFGVRKVILSCGRFPYPLNDAQGQFGMTQITFGLLVDSHQEGERVVAGLQHPAFQQLLAACKWCTFYIDWRMFQWLRRDFYVRLP